MMVSFSMRKGMMQPSCESEIDKGTVLYLNSRSSIANNIRPVTQGENPEAYTVSIWLLTNKFFFTAFPFLFIYFCCIK